MYLSLILLLSLPPSIHTNSYTHQHTTVIKWLILRKLRDRDASKFHIQLCLALAAMYIIFVVGIDRTANRAGCITVGVLIHYFALTSWMWMGAEALLMFQKLIIVFGHITYRYLVLVSLACWGKYTKVSIEFPWTCDLPTTKLWFMFLTSSWRNASS